MEAKHMSNRWILTSLCVLVYVMSGIPTAHSVSNGNTNRLERNEGTDDRSDFQDTHNESVNDPSQAADESRSRYMNSSLNGTEATANVSRLIYIGPTHNGSKATVANVSDSRFMGSSRKVKASATSVSDSRLSQNENKAKAILSGSQYTNSSYNGINATSPNLSDSRYTDSSYNKTVASAVTATENSSKVDNLADSQHLELSTGNGSKSMLDNDTHCPNQYVTLARNQILPVTLRTFESQQCSFHVYAPPGFGIQLSVLHAQSDWSIYNFFYVKTDSTDKECWNDIIALIGPSQSSCNMTINSANLEINTDVGSTIQLLAVRSRDTSDSQNGLDSSDCNPYQNVSHDIGLMKTCGRVERYTNVYNIAHLYIEQYQELTILHPSLRPVFPESSYSTSEIPEFGLSRNENIQVAEYPECPEGCICSLNINQFITDCLDGRQVEKTLLIYMYETFSTEFQVNTSALDVSARQLVHVSPGSFRNLTNVNILLLDNNLISSLHQGHFEGLFQLQVLDLSYNKLLYINSSSFSGLTGIKQLFLNNNLLSVLTVSMFAGIHNIEVLYLSENKISTIEPAVFSNLKKIKVLSLSDNVIVQLDQNIFHDLKNVHFLDLTENIIVKLDKHTFKNLKIMTHLSLQGNQIAKLQDMTNSSVFQNLVQLTHLNLANNKLSHLDEVLFKGLVNVLDLSLNDNVLKTLAPGAFWDCVNLSNLHLYENPLTFLHVDQFQGLHTLSVLYLDTNRLTALGPGIFDDLGQLKELHLYDNQLSILNVDIFQGLVNLSILWLHNNYLTAISPGLFRNLRQLTQLSLYDNQLSNLHVDIFQGLVNLTDLRLYNNTLTTLQPGLFRNLSKLTQLYLGGNTLTILQPGQFRNLRQLMKLSMYDNQLSNLHVDIFQGLVNLSTLWLHNNNLTTLQPGVFRNLRQLKLLSLNDNQLSNLNVDIFHGLVNLTDLWLQNNTLTSLQPQLFQNLSQLTHLTLHDNRLSNLHVDIFQGLVNLSELRLQNNTLTTLQPGVFRNVRQLTKLHLHDNRLSNLHIDIFQGLINLSVLTLYYNKLTLLKKGIFRDLVNLTVLSLSNNMLMTSALIGLRDCDKLQVLTLHHNKLSNIDVSFSGLHKLVTLELQSNQISVIQPYAFQNQTNMKFISLNDNPLSKITSKSFAGLPNTTSLIVDSPATCCFIDSLSGPICISTEPKSEYMTCNELLPNTLIKYSMWIIGLFALLGNTYVLVRGCRKLTRGKEQTEYQKQVLFITNLAAADFLMGVYMLIIASADQYFQQYFPSEADQWKSHALCKLSGFLSILSSESSLFFILLIGIDRFWAFRNTVVSQKLFLTTRSKILVTILVWMLALVISALGIGLEKDQHLYQFSEVCIGLPLARRLLTHKTSGNVTISYNKIDRPDDVVPFFKNEKVGSHLSPTYSIVLFLGVNFFCCITVAICYISLFIQIRRSNMSRLKTDLKMAFKMGLITLTDLLCWLPIVVIGILVQRETLEVSPEVFAWIIGFVLPINSALNPFLYTIIGNSLFSCLDRKGNINGNIYIMIDETAV